MSDPPQPKGPESYRERPRGKNSKEMKLYMKDLRTAALSVGAGGFKVKDPTSFEKALIKYAEIRSRRSSADALLGATVELDARDVPEFRSRLGHLEERLFGAGFIHAANESLKPEIETMSEEELLRGLEGLAPQQETIPATAEKTPSATQAEGELDINAVFEKLKAMGERNNEAPKDDPNAIPESFERAYTVFQELRRTGTPQEDQIPLASRGLISNADYPRFKSFVQERQAAAERGKNAAKKERREVRRGEAKPEQSPESAEKKQARLKEVARIFFDRVEKGADATFMYQVAENSLPEKDIRDFKDLLEKNGAHINGTSGKDMPPFVEAAATHKEAKEMLGRPDGSVGDVPYWNLPGKSAAVFDRPSPGFQKYVLTIQDGGVHRFPGGWHEYRDGAFHAIDEETVLARRASAASTRREAAAAQPAERTRPADSPIERTAAGESGAEASPVDAARKMFLRKYHKERMKAGKAFNESTKRLDVDEKLELVEELRETTDIPDGILDGIASNLRHDAKKGDAEGRRAGRLEREIEEDIAAIGGKRSAESAPRETRRGRESAQERLNREIEEDIAKVLAKK